MNTPTSGLPGSRIGRVVAKIARRAGGFVLLTITVGLTTCSALDAVKAGDSTPAVESTLEGDAQ